MSQIILFLLLTGDYLSDASAVLEKDITHITVDRDFSCREEKEISIFILTYRGREIFGNLLERYNKETEEIRILNAKTQKKTGEEIAPDKKAIGDLSTVEKFLAPRYANSRIKSIAFSAVEESSRIILHSQKISRKKRREFFGSKVFQKEEPVLHSQISLETPFPLKYQIIGKVKVKEEKRDDYFSYQFLCESLPRVKTEPGRVAISEISPRVYWTNLKDWKEVWNLLKRDFYQGVVIKGDLAKKAKELAQNGTKMEIIREIYDYVTKNWRDIPLTILDAGFKPNRADEVYTQKYADNKDKCLLLLTMLKAAGLTAYPAYVAQEIVREIPSPIYFSYLTVCLEMEGDYIFLDPAFPERTSFALSFPSILKNYNEGFPLLPDLIGREVFLIKPDTFLFRSIPYPKPEDLTSEIYYSVSSDSFGNLSGGIDIILNGLSAIAARINYKDKTEVEKEIALKEAIAQIKTGTRLLSWRIENLQEPQKPVKLSLRFATEKYGMKERDRIHLNLPPFLFLTDFANYFTPSERKYPLDIKIPSSYLYHFQLTIPEGSNVFYLPKDFASADSLIELRIFSIQTIPAQKIEINKEIRFRKRYYDPKEYNLLRDLWVDFAKPENRFIILKK